MTVIEEIAAERRRQIEAEGLTPEHDDAYPRGELPRAAASYALAAQWMGDQDKRGSPPSFWPWKDALWKPTTRRRDLIKSAALVIAAIEQLDRAEARKKERASQ